MTMTLPVPDLAAIAGQFHAKRALEVAACGGDLLSPISRTCPSVSFSSSSSSAILVTVTTCFKAFSELA